jgi:hypothetical protein
VQPKPQGASASRQTPSPDTSAKEGQSCFGLPALRSFTGLEIDVKPKIVSFEEELANLAKWEFCEAPTIGAEDWAVPSNQRRWADAFCDMATEIVDAVTPGIGKEAAETVFRQLAEDFSVSFSPWGNGMVTVWLIGDMHVDVDLRALVIEAAEKYQDDDPELPPVKSRMATMLRAIADEIDQQE